MANLDIKNLSYKVDGKDILNDVDLKIKKNEFVGILGPNGSGKSTLLKNIYRYYKPLKNSIYLNEKEINEYSIKDFAKNMSVVFQEGNMEFDFLVKDIVSMGRYVHKKLFDIDFDDDKELIKDALDKVEMKDFYNRSFLSLSGGEKQRVLIARAIAQDSKMIVLDEPTNHLDIKYKLNTMKILKDINKTIFAAIHDFNIAINYCDNIYIIDNGIIKYHGDPKKLLNKDIIKEVFNVNSYIYKNEETNNYSISFYI
ncbi:MAG: ABC transporter ATP-binding protein [Peptostreptococcaceae bacterium]|jgi:iron complex transport system ATP-binding protein|nr:ABC transporter ATP-binding protein [Peptostreptococcaceae bacterium]